MCRAGAALFAAAPDNLILCTLQVYKSETGEVRYSSLLSQAIAWVELSPHISSLGIKDAHTSGRAGMPKILHWLSVVN
jgi:hypothetical protein